MTHEKALMEIESLYKCGKRERAMMGDNEQLFLPRNSRSTRRGNQGYALQRKRSIVFFTIKKHTEICSKFLRRCLSYAN